MTEGTPTETGLVFDKYKIIRRLAVGGMGEVFLAKQTGIGGFQRQVILKSLLPDLAEQESFVDQFLDEARVAASLNHSNIVQIYEVGKWRGLYFIAMEYIRGGNLADLRKRAKRAGEEIPIGCAVRILHDATLGLEAAHQAVDHEGKPLHLVHRDISPQNIMVRSDGHTKVVDFGIALASNRATRTATGVLKGKYAYMSPEQIAGKELDGRSDQFSLGVVFWELFAGRRLFKADTDANVLRKVLAAEVPPVSRLRADFPDYLSKVLQKMLMRHPQQRFATMEEVATALMPYLKAEHTGGSMVDLQAFTKRVGFGETVDQVTPSGSGDFLLSLKPFPVDAEGMPEEVALDAEDVPLALTVETPSIDLLAEGRVGSSRKKWLAAGGILAALLLAGGLYAALVPTPPGTRPPAPETEAVAATPTPAPAAPATARLSLKTDPPGATIHLDEALLGPSPRKLEALEPGTPLRLRFELEGHESEERELSLEPGERRTLEIALKPLPPVRAATGKRGRGKRGARRPRAAVSSAPGFLTLKTTPWTEVSVDGRALGMTPLFKQSLSAGRHTLLLTNEKAGVSETRVVQVPPGKTLKLDLKLR